MYIYIYVCIGIFHGNYVIVCDTYYSVIHIRFYMLFGNDVSFAILSIVAQYIAKELSAIHRKWPAPQYHSIQTIPHKIICVIWYWFKPNSMGTGFDMMTSSNGNIFSVTGPLCGEFTGPGEFPTQRPVTQSFDVFFDLCLNNGWVNNREAGDLRRHCGHYDVNVMNNYFNTSRSRYLCFVLPYDVKLSIFFTGGAISHFRGEIENNGISL